MTKLLKVGTKVKARRAIYNPHTKTDHSTGTIGEIVAVGIDAQFGFYVIKMNNEQFLTDIKNWEVLEK